MNKKNIKLFYLNQKGTAVLLTVLILTSLLFVALGVTEILQRSLKLSNISGRSQPAYLVAESGIERLLWEIRKNDSNGTSTPGTDIGDGFSSFTFVPDLSFSNSSASYEAKYKDYLDSGKEMREVQIIGQFYDAQRKIRIEYQKSD